MIVEIPNVGRVEFPDSMSEAEIAAAAKRLHADASRGSAADSVAQGVSLGFADELAGALGAIPASLQTGESIGDAYTGIRDAARANADAYRQRAPGASLAAEVAGGLLTGGVGGGRAVAGASGRELLRQSAGVGAGLGAASGLGYSEADTAGGMAADTVAGGLLGGAAGAAFPALGSKMAQYRQAAMDARSSAPYTRSVARLEGRGIPLSTGQATGSNFLKQVETTLPDVPLGGKPLQRMQETQRARVQQELWKMIGLDDVADDGLLTRENVDRARDMFSRQYGEALGGKTIDLADDTFLNDLASIESRWRNSGDDEAERAVKKMVERLLEDATSGPKTGEWYQGKRSMLANLSKTQGPKGRVYGDIKRALDDAFARAAGENVVGDINSRYKSFKQLEQAYQRIAGGAAGAEGLVPLGQIARSSSKANTAPEWEEFTRDAYSVIGDRLGNSGTAARNYTMQMLTGGGMGLLDPSALIYGPMIANAASRTMASGARFDIPSMLPSGGLLMRRGVAPAAAGVPLIQGER